MVAEFTNYAYQYMLFAIAAVQVTASPCVNAATPVTPGVMTELTYLVWNQIYPYFGLAQISDVKKFDALSRSGAVLSLVPFQTSPSDIQLWIFPKLISSSQMPSVYGIVSYDSSWVINQGSNNVYYVKSDTTAAPACTQVAAPDGCGSVSLVPYVFNSAQSDVQVQASQGVQNGQIIMFNAQSPLVNLRIDIIEDVVNLQYGLDPDTTLIITQALY